MPKGVYDHSNRSNKKNEILQAAMKIYAFYGFEGATMDRMAAAAGVSKALILKYFGSKQGLVREMASTAVKRNMEQISRIDETPGLTLRQREERIFAILKAEREEWCLILGTLLVPNFNFQLRSEIEGYIDAEYKTVQNHMTELREPSREVAFAYAYAMAGMRMGYIVDGKEQRYRNAADIQMKLYLR